LPASGGSREQQGGVQQFQGRSVTGLFDQQLGCGEMFLGLLQ
jgi:hypothetical protein